ncbi:trypsin-1-like [Uloborus diversus]|uniref:trypsin-1-like n=1 Tax=Uloborus diversus TaxID=327109 RepID=UPI0024096214|nr:trypsin-1-like [Uloborus diversus]
MMIWYIVFQALFLHAHGSIMDGLWSWKESTCGESRTDNYQMDNDKRKGYIVGGRDAFQGEFPWQISLQRHFDRDNGIYHICGGTIIEKEWVVTAAHCVNLAKLSKYRVVAGTSDLSEENKIRFGEEKKSSVHEVIDGRIHEGFSTFTLQNDIALLKVQPPFEVGRGDGGVRSICLPAPGHEPRGHAVVSGWGALKEGGRVIPTRLQAVTLPLISDEECRKAYGDAIVETMLCAGYKAGQKDSCQGDSGGPLIQKSDSGYSTLIGVVSWGRGCARPKFPGVYTQVSHYIEWINKIIKSDSTFDDFDKFF